MSRIHHRSIWHEPSIFRRYSSAFLPGCLVILVYLLVALDSANLLLLLMRLGIYGAAAYGSVLHRRPKDQVLGKALPTVFARVFVQAEAEVGDASAHRGGISVSYGRDRDRRLGSDSCCGAEGLSKSFSCFAEPIMKRPAGYWSKSSTPEIERYGIEVFRIHIAKIQLPSSQHYSVANHCSAGDIISADAPKSFAAKAN